MDKIIANNYKTVFTMNWKCDCGTIQTITKEVSVYKAIEDQVKTVKCWHCKKTSILSFDLGDKIEQIKQIYFKDER